MKKNKDSLLLYIISVGLVILAIAITSIINNLNNKEPAADVRARAGSVNTLKFWGTVNSINMTARTIMVDNLNFAERQTGNLGTWTIGVPTTFNFSTVYPGIKVVIAVDAATFKIDSHSTSAVEIAPYK